MPHELRHALRAIAHAKGVAAVLLLSLGLGTGVNAAVYDVLASLLMGGPPGAGDPSGLLAVHTSEYSGSAFGQSSYPDFLSIATGTKAIATWASTTARETCACRRATGCPGRMRKRRRLLLRCRMRAHAGRIDRRTAPTRTAVVSFQLGAARRRRRRVRKH